MTGLLAADRVNVLVNRVSGSLIPLFAHPLHRGQYFYELAHFIAHDVPAFANMAIEGQGFVLRENVNPSQIGVDAVGKRNVDDAIDAAEGDSGFCAIAGEGIQSFSGSAR